jgi:hypothetical protein
LLLKIRGATALCIGGKMFKSYIKEPDWHQSPLSNGPPIPFLDQPVTGCNYKKLLWINPSTVSVLGPSRKWITHSIFYPFYFHSLAGNLALDSKRDHLNSSKRIWQFGPWHMEFHWKKDRVRSFWAEEQVGQRWEEM